ncbi:MAG: hypothetical protein R2813_12930 [Flavobacteriales bacterium]
MKNSLFLALAIGLASLSTFGQTKFGAYEAKYGPTSTLKGKDGIKSTQIIGETEKDVYMVLSGDRSDFRGEGGKVELQRIDKKTLKVDKTIELDESINKDKTYRIQDILSTSNGFMSVAEVKKDGRKTVYVSYIDYNLNIVGFPNKVTDYDYLKEDLRLIQRPNSTDFVVLLQKYAKPDEPIIVKYDLYDEKLKVKHTGEVDMNITYEKKKGLFASNPARSLLNKFEYSENGELVYMTWIVEGKGSNKVGNYKLIFLNPLTDKVDQKQLFADEDVYIGEHTILEIDGDIVLSGLYSNDKKLVLSIWNNTSRPSVNSFNGTFFIRYDNKTHNQVVNVHTPFEQKMMNQLTQTNPAVNKGLFGKKRANKDQDDVSGNYEINKIVYSEEDKKATFYCEYIYNTVHTSTTTNANGGTTTKTTYTSTRGNLFYYELSLQDGSLNYFNTIRKYATYSSGNSSVWYYKTLFVVPREEGEILFYNSQRIFNENDPKDVTGVKIKTKKLEQDYFVSEIDRKTGKYNTETPSLVPTKLKPYEKLQMDRCFVSDLERACYTINSQYKYRMDLAVISCVTMPLCCAGYFVYMFTLKKGFDETYTISRVTF